MIGSCQFIFAKIGQYGLMIDDVDHRWWRLIAEGMIVVVFKDLRMLMIHELSSAYGSEWPPMMHENQNHHWTIYEPSLKSLNHHLIIIEPSTTHNWPITVSEASSHPVLAGDLYEFEYSTSFGASNAASPGVGKWAAVVKAWLSSVKVGLELVGGEVLGIHHILVVD